MGFGESFVVVVVDFIVGFIDFELFFVGFFDSEVDVICCFFDVVCVVGVLVVYMMMVYCKGLVDVGYFLCKVFLFGVLFEGLCWVEFDLWFGWQVKEDFLVKKYVSVFFGMFFVLLFIVCGVDIVLVIGCMMLGCVWVIVVDVLQNGFCLMVVEECVGDCLEEVYCVNLFDIEGKYGDVVLFEEVLCQLCVLF